ncbi:MAG: hypothetical protein JXQ72_15970 [Anaerolineae bacterium]|nr:hypothetical protein [Anaerolineae bacterium]
MSRYLTLLAVLLALILTACADEGSAPDAIEKYLKAKISSDADKLVKLSCKAWEAQAQLDAAPFESVNAELQDMSCKDTGKDGEYTLVTCDGTLVIEYRGEDPRQQDLSETIYRAIKEDGEWRMCGEQ